jgi:hypothetical protein
MLRLPTSYHEDVNGWAGPDSSTIRILRQPRRPPLPPGDYLRTGPVCTQELGGHVVDLSMWMEFYPRWSRSARVGGLGGDSR